MRSSTLAKSGTSEAEIRSLAVSAMQKNPRAHDRIYYDPAKVAAFAEQMRAGVVFPPIRVWWDGITHWLADGLHRLLAAEQAGISEILCAVHLGTESKAAWDCYAHLAAHACRGSLEERRSFAALVFQHPDAAALSDDRIAQHLGVAESLVRQWKRRFSGQSEQAGPFGVSDSQLWRPFRVASRHTPKALLTTVRVERAQELVRCTKLAPKDISFRVGDKTALERDRAFSLVNGVRLREYRRLHAAKALRESKCGS